MELSGIPDGTRWFAESGPAAPKSAVALSPGGGFCCVEGNVTFTIILPNGLPICDQAREIYIDTDDKGIWKVHASIFGMKIDKAVASFERNLRPLLLSPELKITKEKSLDETIKGFSGEITNRSYDFGFYLKSPTFNFQFMPGTFQQKNALNYRYIVDLPHIEAYARPHPLPKVADPAQLVQDCRNLLQSGADLDIAKERWTPAIATLKPRGVKVVDGAILLLFESGIAAGFPAVYGAHYYAIGPRDDLPNSPHFKILSTPYPGIYDILWHS